MTGMFNPAHPGEIVRESMEELGLTVSALAAHLKITRANLSRIVNGKGGISAQMSALRSLRHIAGPVAEDAGQSRPVDRLPQSQGEDRPDPESGLISGHCGVYGD